MEYDSKNVWHLKRSDGTPRDIYQAFPKQFFSIIFQS